MCTPCHHFCTFLCGGSSKTGFRAKCVPRMCTPCHTFFFTVNAGVNGDFPPAQIRAKGVRETLIWLRRGVRAAPPWQRSRNKNTHKTALKRVGTRVSRHPRHQSGQETASEPAHMNKVSTYTIFVCALRINTLPWQHIIVPRLQETAKTRLKMIMRGRILSTIIFIIRYLYGFFRLPSALSLLMVSENLAVNKIFLIFVSAPLAGMPYLSLKRPQIKVTIQPGFRGYSSKIPSKQKW